MSKANPQAILGHHCYTESWTLYKISVLDGIVSYSYLATLKMLWETLYQDTSSIV